MFFLLFSVALLVFMAVYALMGVWAERKISAWIQDRVGPVETGKFGLLQTFADMIKMLQKEDLVPFKADKLLFWIAPVLVFASVFMGFAVMPFSPSYISSNIEIGLFYALSIVAIEVVGILMAGWASHNKYAIYGSMRSIAQIIAYEIPAGIAVLSAVMLYQSLNLQEIALQQGIYHKQATYFMGFWNVQQVGGFFSWGIFQAPHLLIAAIIYFICSLAEANRTPFDIPEAESELVSGFHVEYSGFKFGALFLAEYSMMFLTSMILVILFLGAWYSPLPNIGSFALAEYTNGTFWGVFWILIKTLLLVVAQMWVRWTLPRYRADQLMNFCWKVLLPLSFLCLFASAVWKLFVIAI
jgi:NADH-quinone oxidoreductase subunit H